MASSSPKTHDSQTAKQQKTTQSDSNPKAPTSQTPPPWDPFLYYPDSSSTLNPKDDNQDSTSHATKKNQKLMLFDGQKTRKKKNKKMKKKMIESSKDEFLSRVSNMVNLKEAEASDLSDIIMKVHQNFSIMNNTWSLFNNNLSCGFFLGAISNDYGDFTKQVIMAYHKDQELMGLNHMLKIIGEADFSRVKKGKDLTPIGPGQLKELKRLILTYLVKRTKKSIAIFEELTDESFIPLEKDYSRWFNDQQGTMKQDEKFKFEARNVIAGLLASYRDDFFSIKCLNDLNKLMPAFSSPLAAVIQTCLIKKLVEEGILHLIASN